MPGVVRFAVYHGGAVMVIALLFAKALGLAAVRWRSIFIPVRARDAALAHIASGMNAKLPTWATQAPMSR